MKGQDKGRYRSEMRSVGDSSGFRKTPFQIKFKPKIWFQIPRDPCCAVAFLQSYLGHIIGAGGGGEGGMSCIHFLKNSYLIVQRYIGELWSFWNDILRTVIPRLLRGICSKFADNNLSSCWGGPWSEKKCKTLSCDLWFKSNLKYRSFALDQTKSLCSASLAWRRQREGGGGGFDETQQRQWRRVSWERSGGWGGGREDQ